MGNLCCFGSQKLDVEDCKKLEIELISATDLEGVGKPYRTKAYATVEAIGHKLRTPTDKKGTNPTWDTKFFLTKAEIKAQRNKLKIELYSKRMWPLKDRHIGSAEVTLNQLDNKEQADGGGYKMKKCRVKRVLSSSASGNSEATLIFKYKLGDGGDGDGNAMPSSCTCNLFAINFPSVFGSC